MSDASTRHVYLKTCYGGKIWEGNLFPLQALYIHKTTWKSFFISFYGHHLLKIWAKVSVEHLTNSEWWGTFGQTCTHIFCRSNYYFMFRNNDSYILPFPFPYGNICGFWLLLACVKSVIHFILANIVQNTYTIFMFHAFSITNNFLDPILLPFLSEVKYWLEGRLNTI